MNESDKAWLDLCMHHDYKTFCESSASITSYEDDTLQRCFNAIMNEQYDANDASTDALRILCQWNDPNGDYDDASRAEMIDILYRWKWESSNK